MSMSAQEMHLPLQNCEIKYRELVGNFKKAVELWFLDGSNEIIIDEIQISALAILQHGLLPVLDRENVHQTLHKAISTVKECRQSTSSDAKINALGGLHEPQSSRILQKLIGDFEWLRISVNMQHYTKTTAFLSDTSLEKLSTQNSYASYLKSWIEVNLRDRCLCACLQLLLSDKDLLTVYYNTEAFLRQEVFVTAFLMCLSAWEQRQQGLLTQMENLLQANNFNSQNKRFNSQPNIFVSPLNINLSKEVRVLPKRSRERERERRRSSHFTVIRKTKSLSTLLEKNMNNLEGPTSYGNMMDAPQRPRCKTFGENCYNATIHKRRGIAKCEKHANVNIIVTPATNANLLPSTSNQSRKYFGSNITVNSSDSSALGSQIASVSSTSSTTSASNIHLINTDDIKIWTDHTWHQQQQQQQLQQTPPRTAATPSCAIPTISTSRVAQRRLNKSVSPINSFLSSICGTSAGNTLDLEHTDYTESNLERLQQQSISASSVNSLPSQSLGSMSHGSSVFDSFLPVCGKKLRQQNVENLFENGISCLDYSVPSRTFVKAKANFNTAARQMESKYPQSLTTFLQNSHLLHNNTQLERENAHFRISEAIISAMEHIKWNNLMAETKQVTEATPLGTDYLAENSINASIKKHSTSKYCSELLEADHTPYAELGEVNTESPSAEIVGLSLISKFKEQHLPKVSELKWLVSEEDAPQKLLPLPNVCNSSNSSDLAMHSIYRGTQYWAPPRPQIIFTDHALPNRKQLLHKQNYRCAGCGMRVPLQNLNSFRYCTYLGKYHCTGCHRNHVTVIPAKILQAWDFKCYPVSVFAYRLLEHIYTYPLFYVPDLNPALYIKVKNLRMARHKRIQLKFIKDFINSCRFAIEEQSYFITIPDHITSDFDNWSIGDFTDAESKCLPQYIDRLIEKCESHIYNCVLCTARGFYCEFCQSNVIIFPWSMNIIRCNRCGSCFHRKCWKSLSEVCCRCKRIDKRRNDNVEDYL